MRAQKGASSAILLVSLLLGGALLGAPSLASAEGTVSFLQMTADRCPESSGCEFRLSCGVGGPQTTEMVPSSTARTKYSVPINKILDINSFPATITCTAWEDDGWFGSTWEEVGTASVEVASGGNYKLNISNKEQGALHVDMAVDSLEIATPAPLAAAKPAAASAASKKSAAPAKTPPVPQVIGAFSPQKDGQAVVVGLDEKAFKDRVYQLSSVGLQLEDVETFEQGGKRLWSGIFKNSQDQVQLITGQDWDKFSTSWKKLTGGRMRLTDMEVYPGGGKNLFAGIFRDLGEGHSLWVGQTRKDFSDKVKELSSYKGQQLIDFQPYGSGTGTLYAGTFRQDPNATEFWTSLKPADFQSKLKGLSGKNMQLVDVETYKEGKDRVYEAIVRTGANGDTVMGVDLNGFAKRWREQVGKGQRLVSLEIYQE
jgi:hypothetical protein